MLGVPTEGGLAQLWMSPNCTRRNRLISDPHGEGADFQSVWGDWKPYLRRLLGRALLTAWSRMRLPACSRTRYEQPPLLFMSRLDQCLVERGLCESREKAKRAILAGMVRVNGQRAHKASDDVGAGDAVALDAVEKYVSRGGEKLEHALRHFHCAVAGQVALDLGASTGGFTDCLLQGGAARVYAVDVGQGQLAWKLRMDARVVVMEKINARDLNPSHFPAPFASVDLVTIDCSFISLRRILPAAAGLLRTGGSIIALIKPQFEAGKAEADRGRGVIKDPAVHAQVLSMLEGFVAEMEGMSWRGVTESPLLGPAGNKEFLTLLEKIF